MGRIRRNIPAPVILGYLELPNLPFEIHKELSGKSRTKYTSTPPLAVDPPILISPQRNWRKKAESQMYAGDCIARLIENRPGLEELDGGILQRSLARLCKGGGRFWGDSYSLFAQEGNTWLQHG